MSIKDYYKILGLNPAATPEKIKQTYRKLAFKYHPDKAFGDKAAEDKFKEVQEAYEVLSDASRKINYDYEYNKQILKQNGHTQTTQTVRNTRSASSSARAAAKPPDTKASQPLTPQLLLQQVIEIRKSVESIKQKGKNIRQEAVYNRLQGLLNPQNILLLQSSGDTQVNRQITHHILQCCRFLAHPYVESISIRLAQLAGTDNDTIEKIYSFTQKRKFWSSLEKNKGLIVLGVISTLLIIIIITLLSL